MSLRNSTSLTPRRADAQRRNAQHSTSPRSEAGKRCVRLNALKHGCDAAPENDAAVMRALGEDPERYEALKQELATAYGPGDALWDQQLADLARLYWRRNRVERMWTGLMRDALEKVEAERRSVARALAEVTYEPSQGSAVAFELPQPAHPLVRRRMLLSLLGLVRDQVRRRFVGSGLPSRVESYYQDALGWRPRRVSQLLKQFAMWAYLREKQNPGELNQYVKEKFGNEAGVEARYQELLGLLDQQIAWEETVFAEESAAQERKDEIARDACLAPEDKTSELLLRQETALDRSIDRKVRILLTLRKEAAQQRKEAAKSPKPQSRSAGPPGDSRSAGPPGQAAAPSPEAAATLSPEETAALSPEETAALSLGERVSRSGAVISRSVTGEGSLPRQEQPAPENTAAADLEPDAATPVNAETSKSPEQSQNVTENKGSRVQEVNA